MKKSIPFCFGRTNEKVNVYFLSGTSGCSKLISNAKWKIFVMTKKGIQEFIRYTIYIQSKKKRVTS